MDSYSSSSPLSAFGYHSNSNQSDRQPSNPIHSVESQESEASNAYNHRATTVPTASRNVCPATPALDRSTTAFANFHNSRPPLPNSASNLAQFSHPNFAVTSVFDMAKSDNIMFSDEPMEFNDMIGEEGLAALSSGFKAVNAREHPPATSSYTVSPQELSLDHSAPNSNTFTNLTTPSMYDGSPDDLSSFEASPLFTAHADGANSAQWPSLFADEDNVLYAPADASTSNVDALGAADMSRCSSSTSAVSGPQDSTPDAIRHRMSISAGVHKNKRTGRLLGPIAVDKADSAAVKRAKNTLAARKSRQKKRDVEDQLRADLAEMAAQRDRWMHIAIAHGAPLPDPRDHKSP